MVVRRDDGGAYTPGGEHNEHTRHLWALMSNQVAHSGPAVTSVAQKNTYRTNDALNARPIPTDR